MEMLPEICQYLDAGSYKQESDKEILRMEVETLYLLATRAGREGRRVVKDGGTYAVIRELHLKIEEEGVRGWCERLVDVLMADEEVGGGGDLEGKGAGVVEEVEDEDDEIVPIF